MMSTARAAMLLFTEKSFNFVVKMYAEAFFEQEQEMFYVPYFNWLYNIIVVYGAYPFHPYVLHNYSVYKNPSMQLLCIILYI